MKNSTGRTDKNGKLINAGDRLRIHSGLELTVYNTKHGYRVAESIEQGRLGNSISLGLFLVDGAEIIEQPQKP